MNQKPSDSIHVNYLFYGALLLLLIATTTCSVLLKENLTGSRFFFWFYSFGQSLFEVSSFIFLGWLLRRFLGRLAFWLFVGAIFVFFLLHLVDFMIERVLDLSVWETIDFLLDETYDNFIHMLDASGISLHMWALFFALFGLLPFFGMLIYRGTDLIARQKPFSVPGSAFLQLFICIPAALFFWDYSGSRIIEPDAYSAFIKSLPWKHTFLEPGSIHLTASSPLRPPPSEEIVRKTIDAVDWQIEKKPNIFLFVVESLREDFITPQIAPHLSQFRETVIRSPSAVSNANSTALSWFAIFHSQFSLHWRQLQSDHWKLGSPALALFKKLGYRVHLYTSADLRYYGMETLLFGENRSLLDSYQSFHQSDASEADRNALTALQSNIASDPSLQSGNIFLVFWDSTHFNYSWPKNYAAPFAPYAKEFDYFKAYQSPQNIELIKNRYRNAIHYVDSLFGHFLSTVSPDSLIVFTGDHGEEFFDNGHLFHNSHLSAAQTTVPLYLKIGYRNERLPLLSQMDIMPTLLDAVSQRTTPILHGESALRPKTWPFAVISRFNANRAPYEFCIHNGHSKLTLQFNDRKHPYSTTHLRILSRRTCLDKHLSNCHAEVHDWIRSEFTPALDRLFPPK
ncbi:MAG: sulfatase-like hydrolase/transferase [Verrucomicrobiota bacterium]|nr:sulfatase-like hydrolase/transferase [Verrucomicrobiota bacterium]